MDMLSQFEGSLKEIGIHWPDIDEDLSFEGFFKYRPSSIQS